MPSYLGLTIGPIYDTLEQARNTRQLWGASYIFSVLMREIIKAAPPDWQLLSPAVDHTKPRYGAGIYPDRCFWSTEIVPTEEQVNAVIKKGLETTATLIGKSESDLAGHTRIAVVKLPASTFQGESALLVLNRHLDVMELRPHIPAKSDKLVHWIEDNIYALQRDGGQQSPPFVAFGTGKHLQHRIPSLTEIALQELSGQQAYKDLVEAKINANIEDYRGNSQMELSRAARKELAEAEEVNYLAFKKDSRTSFRFRHKYVCFVKADGDSVGATLGAIGNQAELLKRFSTQLGSFTQDAVDEIAKWGGLPIFAGGDDLLFVAPVQNKHGAHIFELVQFLETLFPSQALQALGREADASFDKLPALSFGVSIAYHKYPMFEALAATDKLLFEDAKQHPGKNALAFRVLKHSGQAFGTTIGKGADVFPAFLDLLQACRSVKDETAFLTSVMHKLQSLSILLEDAANSQMLDAFFTHHFNESDHHRSGEAAYLKAVRELCQSITQEKLPLVQVLFPTLRFIQFVTQKDHE